MAWTLTYSGTTKSLAEWGMRQCVITEQSLTAGKFTAIIPGDMLATLPWSYQDKITLALNGETKFVGVVLSPKRVGGGVSEMMQLRFADPWWWLGQGTYTQPWWSQESAASYDSPKIALFAELTPGEGWLIQTIGQAISNIVNQCNAYFGGVMQMGTLSGAGFAAKPIPQRLLNVTYEAALRQVLAWVPDAVQQWDYSTTPPTLHLVQRAAATAHSYAFADGTVMMSQEFTKRDDLVVEGIDITYTGLNVLGNIIKITDHAGATTGTRIVKTVIDCSGSAQGSSAVTPTYTPELTRDYRVEVDTVSHGSAEWWLQYGDTGAETADQITVGQHTMELAANAPENAGKTDLGDCNLLWIGGGMPRSRVNAHTRIALVKAYLTITTTTIEDASAAPILTTTVKERRIARLLAPVTDLAGTYSQVVSTGTTSYSGSIVQGLSPSFVVPGIAASLLAAWSVAQFDGAVTITKAECDEPVKLGDVMNLTGGDAEWETMNTTIMGLTRDLDAGTTTITTGVAAHLGLDEYVSLIRMSAVRINVALDLDQQAAGAVTPDPPPPNDLDDLVGPGSIVASTLIGPQTIEITRADSTYKLDMTD